MEKITRTKRCVIDALLELMQEDEFNKITVTQIVQESLIARKTFYLNFKSKEDVIRLWLQSILNQYNQLTPEMSITMEEIWEIHFNHWIRNKASFELLIRHNIYGILLEEMDKTVETYLRPILDHFKREDLKVDDEKFAYYERLITVITWRMMEIWLTTGQKQTAKELSEMCLSLINL